MTTTHPRGLCRHAFLSGGWVAGQGAIVGASLLAIVPDEPDVRRALKELGARTDFCKVIGSFPRAIAEDLS